MKTWSILSSSAFEAIRWSCDPADQEWVRQLLAAPERIIKVSQAKKVACHRWNGRDYYVKRYRYGALQPLEYLFKRSQARGEWLLWNRLKSSGLPIVRHIALGEKRVGGLLREGILVTEGFPGVPLEEATAIPWPAVLELVRRMHDYGLLHRDLHPGNILVQQETGRLCLVDLKGARLKRSLSAAARERNLVFLRAYMPLPVPERIQNLSRRIRMKSIARRSRRCLKINREFGVSKRGGWRWNVRMPYLGGSLGSLLENPDQFRFRGAERLKEGRSSTVIAHEGFALKYFHHRRLAERIRDSLWPSRGRRAYRLAYHLELLGIPTPRPVATATRRSPGAVSQSYLITERIGGAVELGRYLLENPCPAAAVIRSVAGMAAGLHEEGFSHSDLKERNILIDDRNQCWLIDLDALRFVRRIPDARASADLARLNRAVDLEPVLAYRARFLFLRHYLRLRGRRSWRQGLAGDRRTARKS